MNSVERSISDGATKAGLPRGLAMDEFVMTVGCYVKEKITKVLTNKTVEYKDDEIAVRALIEVSEQLFSTEENK